MADSLFDTFPTHLANAKLTPSQFAIRVVELIEAAGLPALLDRFRSHGFDDARPHFDGVHRGRPAREVHVVGDLPFDGITDRDRDRRRRRRLRRRPRATGQCDA